ncbi:type II secretion system protein, partial [Marinicauda pacifica]
MTREAGFTLIEMLIMLIISGFVATLTIEAIRAASTNAIRVAQAARSVAGELIDERIFRTAVEASRTAYQ